jgi:hypothetical protein
VQVISAFLADHVAVYDGKLNVLGGVWAWYDTDALPFRADAALAVVVQITREDRGERRPLAVVMRSPDSREQTVWQGEIVVAAEHASEYVCTGLRLALPLQVAGRHVLALAVDGVEQMAFPLEVGEVRLPR